MKCYPVKPEDMKINDIIVKDYTPVARIAKTEGEVSNTLRLKDINTDEFFGETVNKSVIMKALQNGTYRLVREEKPSEEQIDKDIKESLKLAGVQLNEKRETLDVMYSDEETDNSKHFDAGHAEEWMERNPHGYYNSEDDYGTDADEDEEERYETCSWCGERYPLSDLRKEKDMGYVCHHCAKGIESREGDLEFEDDDDEDFFHNNLFSM